MVKLNLPSVTLCAATSVNIPATAAALRACLDQVTFAECLLLTEAKGNVSDKEIRVVPIARLDSSRAYSEFMLKRLVDHIRTPHCLIVQWDGFVLDASKWDDGFLAYDYIGAPWPQSDSAYSVGNGGFSLRSRRLLEACRDPGFVAGHPEDLAICRLNRRSLESRHGIRFADHAAAERFAFERSAPSQPTFGFHGVFNMIPALGVDRFWRIYRGLDDPSTAFVDYRLLIGQLGNDSGSLARRARLTTDWLSALLRR